MPNMYNKVSSQNLENFRSHSHHNILSTDQLTERTSKIEFCASTSWKMSRVLSLSSLSDTAQQVSLKVGILVSHECEQRDISCNCPVCQIRHSKYRSKLVYLFHMSVSNVTFQVSISGKVLVTESAYKWTFLTMHNGLVSSGMRTVVENTCTIFTDVACRSLTGEGVCSI
jgi:hypothetical protein